LADSNDGEVWRNSENGQNVEGRLDGLDHSETDQGIISEKGKDRDTKIKADGV
jgi:hypothetical protein